MIGSVVGIDIGVPNGNKSPIYIAIELCNWYLIKNNSVVLDCIETNDDIYERVLEDLQGRQILNFEASKEREIRIKIDGEYQFLLSENKAYELDDDMFFIINREEDFLMRYSQDNGFVIDKLSKRKNANLDVN